jgi:hypothetical protein
MSKHPRVLGTTETAIAREEALLGRALPLSFHAWLLENNGRDLDGVHIYPVLDDRDPRKTWDSLSRNLRERWAAWLENFPGRDEEFSRLLPFASFGTGDYYCFDYGHIFRTAETPVVLWSHETGDTEPRGESFEEFRKRLLEGEFKHD